MPYNGILSCRSVTKAMLNRATQLLARNELLRHRGVTVSVVTPGWVRPSAKVKLLETSFPSAPSCSQHGTGVCAEAASLQGCMV